MDLDPDEVGRLDAAQTEWNRAVRGETAYEQLDRNLNELLQELRVTQTGVQLLFAFLLTLAFTGRFQALAAWQHVTYLITLMTTVGAAALLIAPVAYHRAAFRKRAKARVVSAGHQFARYGLLLLMVAMCGAVLLVTSAVVATAAAVALTAAAAAWFALLWYVVPAAHAHRDAAQAGSRPAGGGTELRR